jgi:hypothetical protein
VIPLLASGSLAAASGWVKITMKVILHIGTHKTGTTSLQHFLTANKAVLAKAGFSYCTEMMPQNKTQHSDIPLLLKRGKVNEAASLLQQVIEMRGDAHTVILSAEEFDDFKLQHLFILRELLEDNEVTVVLYLRNLYDFYYSSLSEHSKLKVYLTSPEALMDRVELRPDDIIIKWESFFGHDNVLVKSYDVAHQGKGLLHDFMDEVLCLNEFPVPDISDGNPSIDHITATLFNRLNSASKLDFRQLWGTYYQFTSKCFRFNNLDRKVHSIFEKTVKRAPVSHPKLRSFRDLLISRPSDAELQKPIFDVLEYLRFLSQLINTTADIVEKNLYLKRNLLDQETISVDTYAHLLNMALAQGEHELADDIRQRIARLPMIKNARQNKRKRSGMRKN